MVDGTPCRQDSNDICVNGECKVLGHTRDGDAKADPRAGECCPPPACTAMGIPLPEHPVHPWEQEHIHLCACARPLSMHRVSHWPVLMMGPCIYSPCRPRHLIFPLKWDLEGYKS